MGFTNSNSAAENSIATAFSNSLVISIADFIEDGSGLGRKDAQATKPKTNGLQSQQQQREPSHTTSSLFCSPYDRFFWFGGDCVRKTASSSLAAIKECATMKTDNTTDVSIASLSRDAPSLVSPSSTLCSMNISFDGSANEASIEMVDDNNRNPNNKSTQDDSISSNEMNTNANTDIISRYNQKYLSVGESPDLYLNQKSLFTDHTDYDDPMNSMLIEDHTDGSKNSRNRDRNRGKINDKNNVHSDYFDKYLENSNSAVACNEKTTEPDEEVWFSASALAASAWCSGYPSLLMYNTSNDTKHETERQQQNEPPDYYAEFARRRQYAFDEDDCNGSTNTLPSLVDSDNSPSTPSTEAASSVSDGNSVLTSVSSIQSFNVITRPHTHSMSSSTRLVEKLERKSRPSFQRVTPEKDQHRHTSRKFTGIPVPDQIRGTNDDCDSDGNPFDYALTQSLMRKLQKHLPNAKQGDSFWLQYSLIRDGASLDSLLEMVRRDTNNTSNNICSVLAIETVEGEVFGAFLTNTWRRSNRQWYGGAQSFLWTTSLGTKPPTNGKSEEKERDSNLSVFPYSFENSYVQLCDRDRLLVGGGDGGSNYERHRYGFGLALERDLLTGSSCPCTTFQSPSLSKFHSDGSTFEIRNLEVWTLTPCLTMVDNPSQGLVHVHNKENKKKSKRKKAAAAAAAAATTTTTTTRARGDGARNTTQNDQSCQDFYNCSSGACQSVDVGDIDTDRDLGTRSFPGADQDFVRNRNARRYNCQRRKNRNKYLTVSM
eukprot:CAMPEP_0197186080 /NCGR_PEP_ID=MMETSP1423-20130617/13178_1 /TAXON_ID=476441 /ORGANISM="Pseudo-nitzschia heimii, Strain UNC1101" /LENGTH=768 /DNA_ID=CAMNT_0042637293 /DNA_START=24 /DNA_END=2330 /DNA_ORIENTATION=-